MRIGLPVIGWKKMQRQKRVGGARVKNMYDYRGSRAQKRKVRLIGVEVPRFRGLNLRLGNQPLRDKPVVRGGPRRRGRFNFKVWTSDKPDELGFDPIMWNGEHLTVEAENSNAAAKKVVNILRRGGEIQMDALDPYDFYMTSEAEINPERKDAVTRDIPPRTRFYHYEGRYISKPSIFTKKYRGRVREVAVEGLAEVSAFDGERFSVPFPSTDMERVKEAVRKVLNGIASIRAIQRQSMLGNKSIQNRMKFIEAKIAAHRRAAGAALRPLSLKPIPPPLRNGGAVRFNPMLQLGPKKGGLSRRAGDPVASGWGWPEGVVRSRYFPPASIHADPFGLPQNV